MSSQRRRRLQGCGGDSWWQEEGQGQVRGEGRESVAGGQRQVRRGGRVWWGDRGR